MFTAAGKERAAAVTPLACDHRRGCGWTGVKAMVMKEGLTASLLGMSYLGRLSRIEATPKDSGPQPLIFSPRAAL